MAKAREQFYRLVEIARQVVPELPIETEQARGLLLAKIGSWRVLEKPNVWLVIDGDGNDQCRFEQ